MSSATTHRQRAQFINRLIDQALLESVMPPQHSLLQLLQILPLKQLVERIRKRATLLAKRRPNDIGQLLSARDRLIQRLYAAKVPHGWACAWCDGSSIKLDSHYQAGIGGIVWDSNGDEIARLCQYIGNFQAFDAELAAVAAVIDSAVSQQQRLLWVFTDNYGLAQLWQEHRDDRRLAEIRGLTAKLDRFALQAIPRQHNQPANALARAARSKAVK